MQVKFRVNKKMKAIYVKSQSAYIHNATLYGNAYKNPDMT